MSYSEPSTPPDDRDESSGGRWAARLDQAKNYRKRREHGWRQNRQILLGESYRGAYVKRSDTVNLAWAAFQTMIGQVYARNPEAIVRETTPELQLVARMLTAVVDEDLEAMQARYCNRLAMADVFWAGFGIVMEKLSSDITSAAFKFTSSEGEVPVPEKQRYTLHRIHPETFLTDPAGVMPNQADHKWSALEFFPTIKELRKNKLFEVDESVLASLPKIKTSPIMSERVTDYFSKADDDPDPEFAQVSIYEIWDRINREVIYMPKGSNKIIGQRDWPVELRLNGELLFPWSILYFNENPDEFWPIPEIEMVRPQLQQYSLLFRSILEDAMAKWRKFLARGEMLQKGHIDKLRKGSGTEVITIESQKWQGKPDFPLSAVIEPIKDPYVYQDQTVVLNLVKQTVHEIMGAGDFAAGGFRSTRSATEAAALSDFLKSRMTNRTENVDAFFKRQVTVHVLYLQETAVENRRVRMIDRDGLTVWREYNKDGIKGKFDFRITAGSSMPQNTELARQENLQFFQQVVGLVAQQGGDIRPLIEWIAPFYRMPQSIVDQMFKGHRQALMDVATMIQKAFNGQPTDPKAFMDAVSSAVMTGLSPSEIMLVQKNSMAPGGQNQQPGGLPGTNTTDQTVS